MKYYERLFWIFCFLSLPFLGLILHLYNDSHDKSAGQVVDLFSVSTTDYLSYRDTINTTLLQNIKSLEIALHQSQDLSLWAQDVQSDFSLIIPKVQDITPWTQLDSNHQQIQAFLQVNTLLQKLADQGDSLTAITLLNSLKKLQLSWQNNLTELWWQMPKFWFNYGFLNKKTLDAYENALSQKSPLAQNARAYSQYLQYKLWHKMGNKAIFGVSPWLFYSQDVDYLVNTSPTNTRFLLENKENPLPAILSFKNALAQQNIDLWIVIIPTKASIYPEFLNPKTPLFTQEHIDPHHHTPAFLQKLSELGINTISLFSAFMQQKIQLKNQKSNQDLYLWHDTHWSPAGAELAAQVVANTLKTHYQQQSAEWSKFFSPTQNYCPSETTITRSGDIVDMSGLEQLSPAFLKIPFAKQSVKAHPVWECDSVGQRINPIANDIRNAQILVLGDSYSRIFQTDAPGNAGWIAHLGLQLQQPIASIVTDGGASTLVREKLYRKKSLLKNKKIVIWEIVERDLRFGDQGWKILE